MKRNKQPGTNNKYQRTAGLFFDVPLVLLPSKRDEIEAFWQTKLRGEAIEWEERVAPFAVRHFDAETLAEIFAQEEGGPGLEEELADEAEQENEPQRENSIAVIPLHGVMSQRISLIEAMSGGVSTEMVGAAFREAMADESVKAIVLHIDSPGGSSYGVTELANQIMDARGTKPIVGIADSVGASGAYWIGAALDYFYVTPGGLVGSIGVYAMHADWSKNLETEGIDVTLISAGKNKTRGNPYEPLSDDDVAYIQGLVNETYDQFISDVARGRRVASRRVRSDWGEGDVMHARQALGLGMVDGIKTFEQVLAEVPRLKPRRPGPGNRVAHEAPDESQGMTFDEHAEQVLADLQAFGARARSLADLRAEQGRQLSDERREQILAVVEESEAVIESVKESIPKPESEAARKARLARWREMQAEVAALTGVGAAEE